MSCRVAEGRALRRHGNRSEIIYPGCLVPPLSWKQGTWDSAKRDFICFPDSLFSFSWKMRPFCFVANFPARPQLFAKASSSHVELRTAVPRVRKDLGKPAPEHLRRVFLSSGNRLRLRCCAVTRHVQPRANFAAAAEHVALFGAFAPPPGL